MVIKILIYLSCSKWGSKVTTIEQAQNLKTLQLDDLLQKLVNHEIHLQEESDDPPKRRAALKVAKEDFDNYDQSHKEKDKAMVMIAGQSRNYLTKPKS